MLKYLISITVLLISSSSFAQIKCPSSQPEVVKAIDSQKTCYEASQIATSCAYGSTLDLGIIEAASRVCTQNIESWPLFHKWIQTNLKKSCLNKYKKESGTMYRSAEAFCQLEVDRVLSLIND